MFGKKDVENGKSTSTKSSGVGIGSVNSLTEGTIIEGQLKSETDIRIDGKVKGTLDCGGKLILGPNGMIEGDIKCQNAVIEGKVIGTLNVVELLDVKESATLQCDLKTGQMRMQSGAVLQGKSQIGGQVLSQFSGKKAKEKDAIAS